MLINFILIILCLIGFSVLLFYLRCIYEQYCQMRNSDVVELFPKKDIYLENACEDDDFYMSINDKINSERWAATQRGSVRIACGAYFTSDEYKEYKENVLNMELP